MVMMDDERNRRVFNEARAGCLLRKSSKDSDSICEIKPKGIKKCLENEPMSCPLWVFTKAITKVQYGV
jgi:hypothetical protein